MKSVGRWKEPHEAWERGDLKRAFNLLKGRVEAGDDSELLNLGYFYDCGLGTKKNKTKAMHLYRRAYQNGEAAAASNIAILYGEKRKHRLAFEWFLRAVRLNDGDAMVEAAKCLIAGVGVRRDIRTARRLLKRALATKYITNSGHEEARVWLAHVAQQGVPGDVAASRRRA